MEKPTFSIQWHITTLCEQKCKHCYLFNSPDAKQEIEGEKLISFDRLKLIADDLVKTCELLKSKPRVSITGGDPILHPYFWDLLSYLRELNIKVSVMGNPFYVTDDVAQRLISLGVNKYQMSLDGLENTHDRLRKPGSFRATTKACDILQHNGLAVSIMSTVSKINAGEIPALIEHVVKIKARAYSFARYCPTHNDIDDMFSPLEYRQFLARIWNVFCRYKESETKLIFKDHLWTLFLVEEGLFELEPSNGVIVDGCGLGISHLSVLADGRVFACRRFNSPVGKVPEQSLFEIFSSEKMNRYRDYSRLEKCRNCELLFYCRGCMAVAYGSTGQWTSPDPQCWKN